jgi:predicted cobalt transporter CbtA
MATSDVLAVIVATIVAILAGVLVTVLFMLVRTLRALRTTVAVLQEETRVLLDDAHDAVRDAAAEVDRIDRLVTSAEKLDGAQRLAYKTLSSPVVKAMAFGSGVSRAAHRLREGEAAPPSAPARAKEKPGRQAS